MASSDQGMLNQILGHAEQALHKTGRRRKDVSCVMRSFSRIEPRATPELARNAHSCTAYRLDIGRRRTNGRQRWCLTSQTQVRRQWLCIA